MRAEVLKFRDSRRDERMPIGERFMRIEDLLD